MLVLKLLLHIVGLIVLPILGFCWGVFVPVFWACVFWSMVFIGLLFAIGSVL